MTLATAEQLLHAATDLELAPAGPLHDAFREAGGHDAPAAAFGQALVRHELLTSFQLDRLIAGNRTGFFYGPAKLLYQIGAGSFARVYRAMNRDTGDIVAVKVLRRRHGADPDKRAAFQREGEMGRLLRHRNIVAIEDVGEEHGASYLTMEFVEGQTLRELTRIRGAIDVPKSLDLTLQMLAGLEYAHRRGVAHRDLKASNVLVSSAGEAKLVDFGQARVDAEGDRLSSRASQPRTLDYAALEKLAGVHDDDIRSDIYFLGTLAYLALAGTPPLRETRDRGERSDPRRFQEVDPLHQRAPHVPREVCDVVARMMHLDPLERWQTAGEVRQAVEKLQGRLTGGGSVPRSESRAERGPESRAEDGGAAATPVRGRVMVVDASQSNQEALRGFFQKLGYRVLLTSNPRRALARFSAQPPPADCLVMSLPSLGAEAVEAFNDLAVDPFLAGIPALLLADPRQREIAERATLDDKRRLVELPLHAETIGRLLESLIGS